MDAIIEKLLNEDKMQKQQEIEDKITNVVNHPTKIYALGGIEEIGKNMYVFEQNDELFIVDCGIKFASEELLGIDAIVCPFDVLVENKQKIKGLIITHGHEDHIGGIPYLLMTVNIPVIYGSKLALEMIKKKLREFDIPKMPTFTTIDDATKIKTKYFLIEFYRVCHSIPDAFGVYIETKNARIIESGDFKFDFSTKGDEFDVIKLAGFGKRDIDLLMCESTNAETEGFAPSEKYVIDELKSIIEMCPGRVYVATFASNLQRIDEIIQIAVKNKRKICLLGRSMNTNVGISIDIGFLNVSKSQFIEAREVNKYPDQEVLILCTGSQGEELAALNQLANGKNVWITFKPTDTIIFSSNPIPGNYESVERLLNLLYMRGVKVCSNSKETKLHTTGHAAQIEQQLLFKLTNPQYIIPIHGEYKMLRALKQNAIDAGIHPDNVIQIANGQIVHILNHKLYTTDDFIEMYDVYVNNGKIDMNSTGTLKYRKTLSEDGIFNVTLVIDLKQKKLLNLPVITTKGTFFVKDSQSLITKIAYSIKDKIEAQIKDAKFINNNLLRRTVANVVQFYIWSNKRKKPLIRTTVFNINK